MNLIKKIINVIKKPEKILIFLGARNYIKLSDKFFLKIRYKCAFNKKLDLDNPLTFNEKLQWLKLNDRDERYVQLVDKYEVKKIVGDIIGEEYIIPTLGIFNKFDEIDFEKLPNQFVIKCTHDSGGIVIVKDKNKMNLAQIKRKINKALRKNYYYAGREWPYKKVKPRIIIEKFIVDKNGVLNDFKLQTFHGKVAYSFVCTDRAKGKVKYTFFDKNKNFIPVTQCGAPNDPKNAKLPSNYEKFVKLAEILAKDIPEVRMDFYNVDGKIYFGEYTFFDSSGFGPFNPSEWDIKFGNMLDLKNLKK